MIKRSGTDYSIIPRNKLDWNKFLKRMAVLEAAKRDSIPADTVKTWFLIAKEMNWSELDLDSKMAQIIKKKSYGNDTVRIDDFFSEEKVYTQSEVRIAVYKRITQIINEAKSILEYSDRNTDLTSYLMDFFKINELEVKVAVADQIKRSFIYERQSMIEELIDKEVEKEKLKGRERRAKIVKFSFEKKKKLIKLLHNKGIISITNEKELNMLAQNIGIFAHDVTDDEIKSINKGDRHEPV